jgi:hypothetical protein
MLLLQLEQQQSLPSACAASSQSCAGAEMADHRLQRQLLRQPADLLQCFLCQLL